MRIEDTVTISAPSDRVWALTADVESWPTHTSTMSSVERLDDGPLEPGSTARVKQPGQPSRTWTVTTVEPERTFAWRARMAGTDMTASHLLESDGDRTLNTLRIDVEGPLAGIVGRLLRRPIAAALRTENAGFKQAAET